MPGSFSNFNWFALATRLPEVIRRSVVIVDRFRAPGADKRQAVLDSIPEAVDLIEFASDMDFLNNENIAKLVGAVVDAEAAALKARQALKDGLLNQPPV